MRLTQMPSEFQKALPVLEKIKEAGFEAYLLEALFEMPPQSSHTRCGHCDVFLSRRDQADFSANG